MVCTHDSIACPEINISHRNETVQYDLQLAQYRVIALICYTCHGNSPCLLTCPKNREHQTRVHWVLENGHRPFGCRYLVWTWAWLDIAPYLMCPSLAVLHQSNILELQKQCKELQKHKLHLNVAKRCNNLLQQMHGSNITISIIMLQRSSSGVVVVG